MDQYTHATLKALSVAFYQKFIAILLYQCARSLLVDATNQTNDKHADEDGNNQDDEEQNPGNQNNMSFEKRIYLCVLCLCGRISEWQQKRKVQ